MIPATMPKQTSRKLIGESVMQAIVRNIMIIIFLHHPYSANLSEGTQLMYPNAGSPNIAIIKPTTTPIAASEGPRNINASTNMNL